MLIVGVGAASLDQVCRGSCVKEAKYDFMECLDGMLGFLFYNTHIKTGNCSVVKANIMSIR